MFEILKEAFRIHLLLFCCESSSIPPSIDSILLSKSVSIALFLARKFMISIVKD